MCHFVKIESNRYVLPMTNLNQSDMNCVVSALIFVSDHAYRCGVTPIIMFGQLHVLWWKAMPMVENEDTNTQLDLVIFLVG